MEKAGEKEPGDPKKDHKLKSRALENPIGRKISKFMEGEGVGFDEVETQIMKDGAIDSETKRLLAIACAASINCDFCVDHHTNLAREEGISEDKITETLLVASLVGFGSRAKYLDKIVEGK